MKPNMSLVGMAGVGKSFTSKLLAEKLNYKYLSVDEIITQEALEIGVDKNLLSDSAFMELEEKAVISLKEETSLIIDTGGSVIYSPKAMEFLEDSSLIVYLFDNVENVKKRFDDRGEPHLIGMTKEMTFEELFEQREKLYKKYAHIEIDVSKHKDNLVDKILSEYKK
jgi:shikimate kinase